MEIDWATITTACMVVILVMVMAYEWRKPKVLKGISAKMLLDRFEESEDILMRARQTKCFQCGNAMRIIKADLYDQNFVKLGCDACGTRMEWVREEIKGKKPRWRLSILTATTTLEPQKPPAPALTPTPTPPPPAGNSGALIRVIEPPPGEASPTGNSPSLVTTNTGTKVNPVLPRGWLGFNLTIFGVICGATWFLLLNLYTFIAQTLYRSGIDMPFATYRNYMFVIIGVIAVIYLLLLKGKWQHLLKSQEET